MALGKESFLLLTEYRSNIILRKIKSADFLQIKTPLNTESGNPIFQRRWAVAFFTFLARKTKKFRAGWMRESV